MKRVLGTTSYNVDPKVKVKDKHFFLVNASHEQLDRATSLFVGA